MRRATLVLSISALGLVSAARLGRAAEPCGLVVTAQPSRSEDKVKQEISYAGEVENRGDRIARLAAARLELVNRSTGKVLGQAKAPLRPPILPPGRHARFMVTVSGKATGAGSATADEKLTFEVGACEPPSAPASAAP